MDISNDQLYSEVRDRVLDTAGGFVEMTRGVDEDDEGYYGDGSDDGVQEYIPPMTVPDGELTAGEVVLLVLTALRNNDNPYVNRGLEILFGYSSPGSQIANEEGLTPAEYGQFLKETEYKALFEHMDVVSSINLLLLKAEWNLFFFGGSDLLLEKLVLCFPVVVFHSRLGNREFLVSGPCYTFSETVLS